MISHTIPDAIAVRREELLLAISNWRHMIDGAEQQLEIAKAELAIIDFAIKAFLPDGEDALVALPAEASAPPPEALTVPKRRRRTKAEMEEARRTLDPAANRLNSARNFLARCGDMGAGGFQITKYRDEVFALVANGEAETFEDNSEVRYRLRQLQSEMPDA